MRVDSIHFYHLFSQFAVLPTTDLIISQTLQHRTVTQITQVRGRGNNKETQGDALFLEKQPHRQIAGSFQVQNATFRHEDFYGLGTGQWG